MPQPGRQERNPAIDAVRGLAILGVVVIHNRFSGDANGDCPALVDALTVAFDWCVLAFFFLSGLLFPTNLPVADAFRRGIRKLLLPFILWNLIYNGLFLALSQTGQVHPPPLPAWQWPLVSPAFQLYFLPCLFAASTVVHAACRVAARQSSKAGEVVLLGILACTLLFHLLSGFPLYSHGGRITMLPLYTAAFACGTLQQKRRLHGTTLLLAAAALMAVVSGANWLLNRDVSPSTVSLLVPPLLLAGAEKLPDTWVSRGCAALGLSAGSIYLWHTPLLMPAVNKAVAHAGVAGAAAYLLTVALTLAGAWSAAILARRVLPRRWRFLFLAGAT